MKNGFTIVYLGSPWWCIMVKITYFDVEQFAERIRVGRSNIIVSVMLYALCKLGCIVMMMLDTGLVG